MVALWDQFGLEAKITPPALGKPRLIGGDGRRK